MSATMKGLIALAAALVIAAIWWARAVPSMATLGLFVCGPLLMLVACRMLDQREADANGRDLRRFAAGQCVDCGYDLRGSAEVCPECGRPIDRPERQLTAPAECAKPYSVSADVGEAAFRLRLRRPTPVATWGDALRANVAGVIAAAAARGACWPNDHFLPGDSFAMMIDDWEGMGWFEVATSVEDDLRVSLDDCYERFLTMTFAQVVDEVIRRLELCEATPSNRWQRDFP